MQRSDQDRSPNHPRLYFHQIVISQERIRHRPPQQHEQASKTTNRTCSSRQEMDSRKLLAPPISSELVLLFMLWLEVVVQVIAETSDHYKDNGKIKSMPEVAEHLHVLAELDSHPREEIAPEQ